MSKMQLNLIWTQAPESLAEVSWIRYLLSGFEVIEHVSSTFDLLKEDSIYVVSSNVHPLIGLPSEFFAGLKSIRRKGIFHISDESYSGGYEVYSKFSFVLRNHYSKLFRHPGIMVLPLGPTNDAMKEFPRRALADRQFLWSFAGGKTAARMEMYKYFQNIDPHYCKLYDSRKQEKPPLNPSAFMKLMSQAVFSPCPMGNVMLETFRLYESLQVGCIPIVERRRSMPYYDLLMPGHPLLVFSSWLEAQQCVHRLSKDQSRLIDYQHNVANWWVDYKARLRVDVTTFVSLGLEGVFQSSLASGWRCRTGLSHQAWRIAELLKHASRQSLQERIGIVWGRLVG